MACSSARKALSSSTRRPSLNGCSASSSSCSTGRSPSSLPACPEPPWLCWLEVGPWDPLGENTRWRRWEGPVHTKVKICCKLRTLCLFLLSEVWLVVSRPFFYLLKPPSVAGTPRSAAAVLIPAPPALTPELHVSHSYFAHVYFWPAEKYFLFRGVKAAGQPHWQYCRSDRERGRVQK